MYKKILVPLDGSKLAEQILPYARVLAEAYKIPIMVLRVNDPEAITAYGPRVKGGEYLKKVSAKFLPACVTVDHVVEMGKAAEVIVDLANAEPGCLIAMATHGLSGVQRWLLGSVANKVVHGATNPMLLIRPGEDQDPALPIQLKTVFVPLDGSGLAEQILPHVKELAKKLRLDVQLVRIYTLPGDAYLVGDGIYISPLTDRGAGIQKEAETYLEGKCEQLRAEGLESVVTTAIEGDPAGEIIDLARKTSNNLVAMSTHGRSGVGRWLLGSVTEKVIQHCKDPVLMIRPR
jgi:nucleotide-binding universal stress UspA family protein